MRVFHSVVIREKTPSKRPRIGSSDEFVLPVFVPYNDTLE